jgi:hypothetical protein
MSTSLARIEVVVAVAQFLQSALSAAKRFDGTSQSEIPHHDRLTSSVEYHVIA